MYRHTHTAFCYKKNKKNGCIFLANAARGGIVLKKEIMVAKTRWQSSLNINSTKADIYKYAV